MPTPPPNSQPSRSASGSQDPRDDAGRNRRRRRLDVDGLRVSREHRPVLRSLRCSCRAADLYRGDSSLRSTGSRHRVDDCRHDARRLRRPLARHRLPRWRDAAARPDARIALRLASRARFHRDRDRRRCAIRGVVLGDDHVLADAGHRARRLDRRLGRLGLRRRALVFGGLLALVALALAFTRISRTALFWSAFVLTRPLGAVLGDFLDKPLEQGGLALSRYTASGVRLRRSQCSFCDPAARAAVSERR